MHFSLMSYTSCGKTKENSYTLKQSRGNYPACCFSEWEFRSDQDVRLATKLQSRIPSNTLISVNSCSFCLLTR